MYIKETISYFIDNIHIYIYIFHEYLHFHNTSISLLFFLKHVCNVYIYIYSCVLHGRYICIHERAFTWLSIAIFFPHTRTQHPYARSSFFSLSLKKRVCGMWYNSRSISNLCWSVPVTSRLQRSIGMRRAAHSLLPFGSHDPNLRKDVDRCCIKSVASVSNTYAARRKSTCCVHRMCIYTYTHTYIHILDANRVSTRIYRKELSDKREKERDG